MNLYQDFTSYKLKEECTWTVSVSAQPQDLVLVLADAPCMQQMLSCDAPSAAASLMQHLQGGRVLKR
jgi:hypothetical protein